MAKSITVSGFGPGPDGNALFPIKDENAGERIRCDDALWGDKKGNVYVGYSRDHQWSGFLRLDGVAHDATDRWD